MNTLDQSLQQFITERLKDAEFTTPDEETVRSFGISDKDAPKTETFVVKLGHKPEYGELAALVASYFLLLGYDVVIKQGCIQEEVSIEEWVKIFPSNHVILAQPNATNNLPGCLATVNHSDIVASFRKSDTDI